MSPTRLPARWLRSVLALVAGLLGLSSLVVAGAPAAHAAPDAAGAVQPVTPPPPA